MRYVVYVGFFFFKQKTAYEVRISDWSSDVCSSDLLGVDSAQSQDCVDPVVVRHENVHDRQGHTARFEPVYCISGAAERHRVKARAHQHPLNSCKDGGVIVEHGNATAPVPSSHSSPPRNSDLSSTPALLPQPV